MKKKKNMLVFYILFFIAAIFFASFTLLQFRSDYLAVIGAGVVLLISGYLIFDQILRGVRKEYDIIKRELQYQNEDMLTVMTQYFEDSQRIQKAQYMTMKKRNDSLDEQLLTINQKIDLTAVLKELEAIREVMIKLEQDQIVLQKESAASKEKLKQLIQLQKSIIAAEQNATKLILRYNKENSRQVALNENWNTNKQIVRWEENMSKLIRAMILSDKKFAGLLQGVVDLGSRPIIVNGEVIAVPPAPESVQEIVENKKKGSKPEAAETNKQRKTNRRNSKPKLSKQDEVQPELIPEPILEPQPEVTPKPVVEPQPETAPEPVVDPQPETAPEPVVEPEPEIIPEPVLDPEPEAKPQIAEVSQDPNRAMSPDEIAAMIAAMSEPAAEPEPPKAEVSQDPNRAMSPDEIAAMIAAMSEPAAEPEPPKAEVSQDPNRAMTPDEIAAMIAAMSEPDAEPEPPKAEVSQDPNRAMTPDEIAAMIANMGV